ncbi:hypothetical protein ACIHDR_37340 [Nocardia sp. NPDC052278]|uniref:hypothetical protein n=1 Tax=unclassified Nocardia TaxID=2637762 RepID=UPI00369F56F1
MTDDNSSIVDQLEKVSAMAEERGYGLRRNPRPPYGWELYTPDGQSPMFGSLDHVERFLTKSGESNLDSSGAALRFAGTFWAQLALRQGDL